MNNSISRNGSNNTTQACAACKYQRRKCGPNCILAPYFPHDRQKQFLNAHKLFGVGKINNLIKPLDPNERDIAMTTVIYQSDMRANDPVGGCYRHIQNLQSQIEYYKAELQLVLQQLAVFKAQAQRQQEQEHVQHVYNPTTTYANMDDIIHAADPLTLNNSGDDVAATPHYHYLQQVAQHEFMVAQESSNNNGTSLQDVDPWAVENMTLSPLSLQDKNDNANEYEYDQKPIFDLIKEMNSNSSPKQ